MAARYKMKTNKSAAKRFSFTATGKLKRKKAGLRHFMRRKSTRAKRNLRTRGYVDSANVGILKKMLPYG
ncbi:MAG: 50S ribosomal protein L35 [Candidatus Lambdaproteobacteria bacterium]|nr:50S ribosomal protein L35 [Candidatus Lambdaproteobacteria bacterium]